MDVFVLGRKQTVSDEIRSLAQAKVARLARLTPVLERAEVRLTEGRDTSGGTRQVCEVTMTGHGHTAVSYTHLDVYKRQVPMELVSSAPVAVELDALPAGSPGVVVTPALPMG